jgi:ParB/RepB/Spo0J family partition protein
MPERRGGKYLERKQVTGKNGKIRWVYKYERTKKRESKQEEPTKESASIAGISSFSMMPFAQIKRIAQYTADKDFDKEKIEQYKNSIAENGYDPAFPMVIDRNKETGEFNVVAGNHRYMAVKALIDEGKLPKDFKIPTVMRQFENAAERELYQVRENQRRNPLATDEAKAYRKAVDQGMTAEQIAKKLGKKTGDINKRLALTNLDSDLMNLVAKKDRSLPVGIAEAIGMHGIKDDGSPNSTIQIKAFNFFKENKAKGYGAGEVISYIKELKSNETQKFFADDGKTDTEKEAMKEVGSEEKAQRNVKILDNTFKTMQTALSRLIGDSMGQVSPKVAKELSASIIAAQGEGSFQSKIGMLDTIMKDLELMKAALSREYANIQGNASTPSFFSSMRKHIQKLHEHNSPSSKMKANIKVVNRMIYLASLAKKQVTE